MCKTHEDTQRVGILKAQNTRWCGFFKFLFITLLEITLMKNLILRPALIFFSSVGYYPHYVQQYTLYI